MSREELPDLLLPSEILLEEQQSLRRALHQFMVKAAIPTGLYPGEDPNDFSGFAQRTRQLLARSPRTILRQALENALVNDSATLQNQMTELKQLLGLESDASLHDIGRKMDSLTKGKMYLRVQATREQLQRQQSLRSKEALRLLIYSGLTRKREKPPTQEEIDCVIEQAVAKKNKRIHRYQTCVHELEKQLLQDAEHRRFCKSNRIWEECGVKKIWENYKRIDLAISRKRNARGTRFEERCCATIFAIIVSQLEKGRRVNGSNFCNYWYDQSVSLWHKNQDVGEIDLVVYHKERGVVAVCEMKSACFDIAIAARQHETKLKVIAGDSSGDWTIGKTAEESLSVSAKALALFLATLLPGKKEKGIVLGAEPLLTHAVCQGIRSQGTLIVDSSNLPLCRPIISMLRDDNPCLDDALAYLESVPPNIDDSCTLNTVDYDQLRDYVLENSSSELFVESPLQCLERFPSDNFIVLPRLEF